MKKNIKKTLGNVIKCMKLRAELTNADFKVYDEESYDIQASTKDIENIPFLSDLDGILRVFFSNWYSVSHMNNSWGFCEYYLSDGEFSEGELDYYSLSLCFPNGALDNVEFE